MTFIERCQADHALHLAQRFQNITAELSHWTACGDNTFVEALARLNPHGPKTFFDIGCNKGYTSAKFFALWAPELGFSPTTIRKRRPEVSCDTCGECHGALQSPVAESQGQVRVFCFEPSQTNFAQLVMTRDAFFADNKPSVQWFTLNLALTNTTGVAQFSRECFRDTMCSLSVQGDKYDLIDTTTVDAFLLKHHIQHVDILKIDTEGFDATVIQGALSSIAQGRVGVILFEYHYYGVWASISLEGVVDELAGLGYICYFDGKANKVHATYTRLTGCWDERYEFHKWSNVVCVPRKHPLYSHMELNSLRHQLYAGHYYRTR